MGGIKNLNLLSIVALMILNASAMAEPCVAEAYSNMLDLVAREQRFDYCGAGRPAGFPENAHRQISPERVSFLVENGLDDYEFRHSFQKLLEETETAGSRGDYGEYVALASRLTEILHKLLPDEKPYFPDRERFPYCVEKIEFSLARTVLEQKIELNPGDVLKIIPDGVLQRWHRICLERCEKFATFRNMIAAGAAIERYRRKNGRLPEKFEDALQANEEISLPRGMHLDYRRRGDEWEIFCGGAEVELSGFDFDVYVPLLSGKPLYDWKFGGCVWLSSSYSRKRKALYHGEVLNKGTEWQCRMDGGIVGK